MLLPVFCGCNKEEGNNNPPLIYAKGNEGNTTLGKIIHTSSGEHEVQLNATFVCAATRELPADETVHLRVDTALVAAYNDKYETDYRVAPEGSYAFSHEATAIIRSGKFQSTDTVQLTITRPEAFTEDAYLLPVRLAPATQQPSSNFGTVYIIIHTEVVHFRGAMGVSGTLTDPEGSWSTNSNDSDASGMLGNVFSYWYPWNLPATAAINFSRPRTLKGLKFTAYHTLYAPGRVSLSKSSDGNTWSSLGTASMLPPVQQEGMAVQYVEFYSPVTTQFLQLTLEDSWAGYGVVLSLLSIIE